MISAAIIGTPPRKRVARHDGWYGQIKQLGVFSSLQSLIRISHNHNNA